MTGPHAHADSHAHTHGGHGHPDHEGHDHTGHGHGHAHGHHGHSHSLPPNPGRVLAIGIALNLAFVGVEWGLGLWSHSLALLADATHNLGDVLGLILAWVAAHLSKRAPSDQYTYGFGASSILAALANGVLLVLVTGGLAWESVQRLQHPQPVEGSVVIWAAVAGVFVNGITAWLLRRGHENDLNMKAAYLHMLGDALVSIAVAVSGALILGTGWLWLDPVMTLVVSAFIVWGSASLLRDSMRMALHAVPPDVDSARVRAYLESLPGVTGVHDLHIWAMSTTGTALTAHLVCPGMPPGDGFLEMAAGEMRERFGIAHTTLQVEAGNCGKGC